MYEQKAYAGHTGIPLPGDDNDKLTGRSKSYLRGLTEADESQ